MSAPTEQCPCFDYVFDLEAKNPGECLVCADQEEDHDPEQGCTVQHRLDEPYDLEASARALRMVRGWLPAPEQPNS